MSTRAVSKCVALTIFSFGFVVAPFCGCNFLCAEDAPAVKQEAPTAAPSEPRPSGFITKVVLAKDTKGDDREAVDPTDVFQPHSVIHAVVHIENAPENTKFKASWYATDVGTVAPANTLIDSYELPTSGTGNIDFTLTPKTSWPLGTYHVIISVNGVDDTKLSYSVK